MPTNMKRRFMQIGAITRLSRDDTAEYQKHRALAPAIPAIRASSGQRAGAGAAEPVT
jgi:hypothetical protein